MRRIRDAIICMGITFLLPGCARENAPGTAQPTGGAAVVEPRRSDWTAVDQAMGRAGAMLAGGVYRYGMPRSDLRVTSQGLEIRASFALGSWIAFRSTGPNEAVATGDLVLTEAELNPVLSRLQEAGIGQTAIHKHLLDEQPAVWWTHIHAHGDPVQIARAVRAALELTGTPPQSDVVAASDLALDTAAIRAALGHSGRDNGGVYNVSIPRTEAIRAMGTELPPAMGLATAINFQPTPDGRAAVNGDFVMTANEVNRVIAVLLQNDIRIVSLHNHLTDEEPRLFFMHFWAVDDPVRLARGLRAALDRTNSRRTGS